MAFNWIQSKLKKQRKKDRHEGQADAPEAPQAVVAHTPTKTVFGPVPWTIWYDSPLELVCEDGRDQGRTIPLEYAFLVLGRGINVEEPRDGWLLFGEETVSRRQAVMCWNDERDSYYLYHLRGATNGTYVDRRAGDQWRIGVGSTVEMGYLRFRIQRRLPSWKTSSFVMSVLERLGQGSEDSHVKTGHALTVIDGPTRGNTYILSRRFHILHKTREDSGVDLLRRGQPADTEQDILVWNDEAQAYMLVHNPQAAGPTFVHGARPTQTFDVFAPVPEAGVEVFSGSPLALRQGDTIRIGDLKLRLHPYVQPLLEGSIKHILQKGYIEKIPPVNELLAAVAAKPLTAPLLDPPPSPLPLEESDDAINEAGGWVDPDQAPDASLYRDRKPPGSDPVVVIDRVALFENLPRRSSTVAPGLAHPAGSEVPVRPRTAAEANGPRAIPRNEPLPFDPMETTLPRPAVDQRTDAPKPDPSPPAFQEPPTVVREKAPTRPSRPAPARPGEPAPSAAGPAEPPVRVPAEPPAHKLPASSPPDAAPEAPAARGRKAAAARPTPPEAETSARRIDLAPRSEPAPPASRRTAPAEPSEAPPQAYELEAVALHGIAPGTLVAVNDETRIVVSERRRVVIGSAETCDLRLAGDTALAAAHAAIEWSEKGLMLRPLDGLPMVNRSICVKETLLRDGDDIGLTRNSMVRIRIL